MIQMETRVEASPLETSPLVEPARLLLVEDNRADASLARALLRDRSDGAAYEVLCVTSLADALCAVHDQSFICALVDLGLPDGDGVDSVRALRAAAPGMPLVVLTGLDDETLGIEALHSGAQDFLVKGQIEGRLLIRSICFAVERINMSGSARGPRRASASSLPFDMSF